MTRRPTAERVLLARAFYSSPSTLPGDPSLPKRPSRPSGPPTFVSKTFTRDEIDRGIEKLRRRIAEVQKLQGVKYNDQTVSTAELNIQEAIREIFGDDSAEYYKHRYYDIWEGSIVIGDSPYDIQRKFEAGILKAVSMLEGLIARLEEKRAELEGAPHRAASLHDLNLHPRIADVVGKLYEGGHYGNAVLDAAIALKNLVQEKSGQHRSGWRPADENRLLSEQPYPGL